MTGNVLKMKNKQNHWENKSFLDEASGGNPGLTDGRVRTSLCTASLSPAAPARWWSDIAVIIMSRRHPSNLHVQLASWQSACQTVSCVFYVYESSQKSPKATNAQISYFRLSGRFGGVWVSPYPRRLATVSESGNSLRNNLKKAFSNLAQGISALHLRFFLVGFVFKHCIVCSKLNVVLVHLLRRI